MTLPFQNYSPFSRNVSQGFSPGPEFPLFSTKRTLPLFIEGGEAELSFPVVLETVGNFVPPYILPDKKWDWLFKSGFFSLPER